MPMNAGSDGQSVAVEVPPDGEQTKGVRSVKSADRTLALLEYLSAVREPPTLRQVAQDLAIPRASAYALLVTLLRRGWVETDGSTYRLGIRSLRAAGAYVELDDGVRETSALMDRLVAHLEETIHLARLDECDIVYLATRPSPHSLSVVLRPGRRLPAWATALGKALLSSRDWEDVDALLPETLEPRTEFTVTDREVLRSQLEEVRQRGYAVDNQEAAVGLRCFAVPVELRQPPIDAISCSVPIARLSPERELEIAGALLETRQILAIR